VNKLVIATIAAASLSVFATSPAAAQQSAADQKIANLNMSAVPDLGRNDVRAIQRALSTKSIDPGPIDGAAGPLTREAVREFQTRYGMKPTGELDNQFLFAIGEAQIAVAGSR
jgi:peptidoglycan hydrolase-like protein with peptidoglycan-binding domain